MQSLIVNLERQRAKSGERNFIERIKAPIFLEAVTIKEPQSKLEKGHLSIFKR